MQGDALLAVQAEDGAEAYTRRGDLQVSATGLVTTGDGRPVLGEGGPLTLPPADSVRIAEDGAVWIVPAGGDPSQPQQVDRLKLVTPAGSRVRKGVDGLFRVENGGALPSDPAGAGHAAQPRRLERPGQPGADRHDRRQPRLGHADQPRHLRARDRHLRRRSDAAAQLPKRRPKEP